MNVLASVRLADDVDGHCSVMEDLERPRGVVYQGLIEPLKVGAEDTPGQVIVGRDGASRPGDAAAVARPAVAELPCPLVHAEAIARRVLVLPWVEGELATRGGEEQVLRLVARVHARTGGGLVDHMYPGRVALRTYGVRQALQCAQA